MGAARNWFNTVRKKFMIRSPQRDITILHYSGNLSDDHQSMIREATADFHNNDVSASSFQRKQLTREDIAATKIQSVFRGHLVSTYST